ncbi:MAG: hypothetical protein K2K91_01460 [Ruminococcus sp.]|nr:hypothetical protein [Ruminococcus sp.]MDE7098449.1 hypothetical protein [Ruminococcus sp.]
MANIIDISDTEAVANTALQIKGLADDFYKEYSDFFNYVEGELSSAWKGADYDAFKAHVSEQKQAYETFKTIMEEYATVLDQAVKAHEQRVEESKIQATQGGNVR